MQRQIEQVWHDVREWEEVAHNMWGEVIDRKAALESAIALTSDFRQYGHYMRKVTSEWPISCENALTDPYLNQKAWIGHAAVAMAEGIPEDITREAWSYLTDEQKYLANAEAERAIMRWKNSYIQNRGLHQILAGQMLF